MEEILHQLRLVVCPIIYRVLYIPGGCLGFLNHQLYYFNYCHGELHSFTWDTFQARSTCHVTVVSGEWQLQLKICGINQSVFNGLLALQSLHSHLNLDYSADSSSEKFQAGHVWLWATMKHQGRWTQKNLENLEHCPIASLPYCIFLIWTMDIHVCLLHDEEKVVKM